MNNQLIVSNQLISYQFFNTAQSQSRAVLFLHGWRSESSVWGSVIQKLITQHPNNDINYYAIDLPGFGRSENPKKDFRIGDYAEVVRGFIEKLELKNVTIVGHSFGGRIGIKLASMHS